MLKSIGTLAPASNIPDPFAGSSDIIFFVLFIVGCAISLVGLLIIGVLHMARKPKFLGGCVFWGGVAMAIIAWWRTFTNYEPATSPLGDHLHWLTAIVLGIYALIYFVIFRATRLNHSH